MICATCGNQISVNEPIDVDGMLILLTIRDDRGVHHGACWGNKVNHSSNTACEQDCGGVATFSEHG
jgi:hypothetical protein